MWKWNIVPATLLAVLAACALPQGDPLPASHPMELERGRPTCTECHEERTTAFDYGRYNHLISFAADHRLQAYQGEQVCAMCHATSFCNDCHAVRVELKPSLKNQTDNFRQFPHRGDYLSRHMIDGRVDPTSCFRCHGNPKAARTCVPCHG